jgi:1-aminocyclopropane-1-carboxylate deaminase/D-cysteine desulfhydrase-like pyridoxal-dependent ACC family enzyme
MLNIIKPDLVQIEAELEINRKAAVIEPVKHPTIAYNKVHVYMKRDDLLHPIISGNK